MTCSSCGRPLASGAKCVYCGRGTEVKRREQLVVPEGSTKAPKRGFRLPWKTILVLLVLGGAAAAFVLHPELQAKLREMIRF